MHTTKPYIGMIATAIEVDADGFYITENSDVQIIVDIDGDKITTVSMKNPDGINHPTTYVSHETSIDDSTWRLIFDQNNSPELTLKAITSKSELLAFKGIQTSIMDQYIELAKSFQLTPNEMKILESLHQAILKRFSVRFKPSFKAETTQVKTKTAPKQTKTEVTQDVK